MRRALIALLAVAAPAVAHADFDPDRLRGGALLHYDVTYVDRRAVADPDPPPAAGDGLVLAGFRVRGFLSRGFPLGYLIGLDVHAGATTTPGGFAYQAELYLVGVGARLGRAGMVGVASGIGASGAVGSLDDAVELPVDAFLELGLGAHLRVLARARATWLGAAPGRGGGAPTFAWTDEVEATFAVRIGDRYRDFGFPTGNGYFLGVAYREAEGARFLGATFGYSVDLGSR